MEFTSGFPFTKPGSGLQDKGGSDEEQPQWTHYLLRYLWKKKLNLISLSNPLLEGRKIDAIIFRVLNGHSVYALNLTLDLIILHTLEYGKV